MGMLTAELQQDPVGAGVDEVEVITVPEGEAREKQGTRQLQKVPEQHCHLGTDGHTRLSGRGV